MAAQGAELVKHYRDLAFMGFAEVVKNRKRKGASATVFRKNRTACALPLRSFHPFGE